jgi:MOSC domain-containing protein YiiM
VNGSVLAIYLAPAAGAELHTTGLATLESGRGLVGDRYYEHSGTFSDQLKGSQKWEITLIEQEEVERFNASQPGALNPGSFRRNIVTVGVRLNDLVGQRFRVGDAVLEGMELCEPCAYLARLLGPEVVKRMVHRAGLRARIVTGAEIRPGDEVAPVSI